MKSKQTICILLTLLLWNPLLLLLLTRSWITTLVATILVFSIAFLVSRNESLRLKAWAFNLCALSSIALHAELLFREFLSDKNIPNLYEIHGKYYFNKPFLDREFRTNEYISHYKTNCQGYRMDETSNANDTLMQCDWLFVGDSFTQGAQVNYNELYTSLLFSHFPSKVIVNAGISGAGLYDELNFFRDKGKHLSPKVVFLQIGVFNDFFNIKERTATYQDYLMEKSDLYRYLAYNVFSTDSLPLGRWTEPFFPTQEDNRDYNILYREQSRQKTADRKAFQQCMKEWKQEVEDVGAKLVLILLPSKEQVSPTLLKEVMDKYHIAQSELDMTAPNRLFASTAKDLGLQAYDLTENFKHSFVFPFFAQDEHLNTTGHKLIASALAQRFNNYADGTTYMGLSGRHERYPTFWSADSTLLLQGQSKDFHYIATRSLYDGTKTILAQSIEELVHPIFSSDHRYLAYTTGNQESSETDVMMMDYALGTTFKLNGENQYAAIPSFSHTGTLLAMPVWTTSQKTVAQIALYDIEKKSFSCTIPSATECWRPIFSNDDSQLLYIQKDGHFRIVTQPVKKLSQSFTLGKPHTLLAPPFDIWDIALSPSGRYLAFAGNKDGNWDLFIYEFATRKVTQLTHTLGNEWDPSFGVTDNDLWFAGTFGFNDGIFYRKIAP